MKLSVIAAAALILLGCVHPQVAELKNWSNTAKSEAKAGDMKWSDYYKQLYERVDKLPEMQGKAFYLKASNVLIDAALAMEQGRVTRAEFESFQRSMKAAESEYNEMLRRQNAAAWAQAADAYNRYLQTQALQAQRWRSSAPIHCTSTQMGNLVNTTCQ